MLRTRIITTVGAVALALAIPAAAGAQQDLRSPDARDAARPIVQNGQDLRSPDARDAARLVAPTEAPVPAVPLDPAPDGFGWGDAGIGAAGTLGIVLALAGIAGLTGHQRRRVDAPVIRH